MGKGDTLRPKSVSEKEFAENYARIFGQKQRFKEIAEAVGEMAEKSNQQEEK